MKQVVLNGDSIRMGYEPVVKAALRDIARVWGPTDNGGDSANVVAHLGEWAIHRLNAHQLAFLGIKVSLERPTIFGRDQQ